MGTQEPNTTNIVCVVDDDPSVLKALKRLLNSAGIAVHTFSGGQAFLAYAASNNVPLAVLDIHMPEMSGLEVRSRLSKRWPQSRVILITGREDLNGRVSKIKASVEAFFTKPFDDTEFLAVIHRVLATRS
jgi:two-component system response regulator HydG